MRPSVYGALIVLMVSVLSGCLSSDPQEEDDDGNTPAPPPAFTSVVSVVDPKGGQGEPSLGVTPEGVLFINGPSHTGNPDPGAAFRSTDGGETWEMVGTPTAPYPNFDPDLAVDVDGNVWFDTLSLGCATVSVSRDQGASWSDPNPAACTGPGGDRQYVVPTVGGTAYIYYHQIPTFYQTVAKTTDYGATWVPLGSAEAAGHSFILDEGSGWGGGGFWDRAGDAVFFTFSWFRDGEVGEGGWFPAYSVTRDGGATWEVGLGPEPKGQAIGLSLVVGAVDEAGSIYLSWAEHVPGTDLQTHIYLAVSTDGGRTWGEATQVDTNPNSKVYPAITAGAAGEVAIAYYEADVRGHPNALEDEATWTVSLAWTKEALNDTVSFQEATLSDGIVKTGRICPSGSGCQESREFLDYFQAKRLPDGRIGAVFNSLETVEDRNVEVFAKTHAPLLSPWS